MTPTRRTGALAALALTLILGACSTPADLAAPTLEPQFGTADNDSGIDVAYPASGRIYVLSEQAGNVPDPYWEGNETFSTRTVLSRYDSGGNLAWEKELISDYCDYDCHQINPRTVLANSQGFIYVLVRDHFTGEDDAYPPYTGYYLYKYDASGYPVTSYAIGNAYRDSPSVNQIAVDVAVDGSGNIYAAVAERPTAWGGETLNFVAKYAASGTLLWQRASPVGTPTSVTVSSNGNVYLAGSTGVVKYSSSGNQGWRVTGDTRDVAAVGTNTVYARNLTTVRKFDANGKQLWSKAQTGLSGLVIADMTTDSSANVYITGKYNASSTDRSAFTRKLAASSGATSFSKTFGTSSYDDARGVATLSGSDVFVTGASQGRFAPPYQGGPNSNDAYLRKLSSGGDPIWTR